MKSSGPPKSRHQPRGVTLLYEDAALLVVDKPCGLLTMGSDRDKSRTVHAILNDYVRKGNPKSRERVYIVHRLDRDTSGILLFARSEQTKLFLQDHWDDTRKYYLALVHGHLDEPQGLLSSYLAENAALNVYSTDQSRGRLAQTAYTLVKKLKGSSLLYIHLLTGRKHQIRVQFADSGHPLLGDRKYGREQGMTVNLALHALSIDFTHPVSGQRLRFTTDMPERFTRLAGSFSLPDSSSGAERLSQGSVE